MADVLLAVIDAELGPWDAIAQTARLRSTDARLPLVVLGPGAQTQPGFLKAALQSGADGVLDRPFDDDTLRAMLEGLVDRAHKETTNQRRFIPLSPSCGLDLEGRCLRQGESEQPLTKGKFDLLEYLVRHAGRAVSADELVRKGVLAPSQRARYRAIVLELRAKLGDASATIRTVPGYGYRFDPPLEGAGEGLSRPLQWS